MQVGVNLDLYEVNKGIAAFLGCLLRAKNLIISRNSSQKTQIDQFSDPTLIFSDKVNKSTDNNVNKL